VPYRVGSGGGSTTTAGGLVLHGDPGGAIHARDAKTGEVLWQFQTGFGAEAPPMVYEVDGQQYIAVVAGGNQGVGSANGDAVWTFALNGRLNPAAAPAQPPTIAGPQTGPIADNAETIRIGANNVEFGYFPKRDRIKAGSHQCWGYAAHRNFF
jgi:quinohemoprotein ethanol dehydrogenase